MILTHNEIGHVGAEHLAAALRVNQVRETFFGLRPYFTAILVTDTGNTGYLVEQGWSCWCRTSGSCIASQPGERKYSPISHSAPFEHYQRH